MRIKWPLIMIILINYSKLTGVIEGSKTSCSLLFTQLLVWPSLTQWGFLELSSTRVESFSLFSWSILVKIVISHKSVFSNFYRVCLSCQKHTVVGIFFFSISSSNSRILIIVRAFALILLMSLLTGRYFR